MNRMTASIIISLILLISSASAACKNDGEILIEQLENQNSINLPEPRFYSDISVEQALLERRSIREYLDESLNLQELSQLLWAAQGITSPYGFRTAPSAGGTYPIELYLVVNDVEGLPQGVYRYLPGEHRIISILEGDVRVTVYNAALEQVWVKEAAVNIVIAAVYERTTDRYGERGIRYVHMEAGHVAQNIYLQAAALNLGTVAIGAFHDDRIKEVINLALQEHPLYIMPVGKLQ
ncbi:MAG: SagB/ThcOx family dehydrogenase [Dehalococcoidales bacterium]|nr:SagB/ThcOx family dehydrogenase [Dehalococcoidales bacterium]